MSSCVLCDHSQPWCCILPCAVDSISAALHAACALCMATVHCTAWPSLLSSALSTTTFVICSSMSYCCAGSSAGLMPRRALRWPSSRRRSPKEKAKARWLTTQVQQCNCIVAVKQVWQHTPLSEPAPIYQTTPCLSNGLQLATGSPLISRLAFFGVVLAYFGVRDESCF